MIGSRYIKVALSVCKSRKKLSLILSWVLLRLKKALRVNFFLKPDNHITLDVVIPTISKDFKTLKLVLESLVNIQHKIDNIYIVSPENSEIKLFCNENKLHFINERDVLGFGFERIDYNFNGQDRRGWLFQQLLKLSGDVITSNENYLCIDSDTVFVSPTTFLNESKFVFFTNEEWNQPYFDTFKKLFFYKAPTNLSFTSHMMIFNHRLLKEMKKELEDKHSKPWFESYISTSSPKIHSCISDYETYANWVLHNYPNLVKPSPFYNYSVSPKELTKLAELCERYERRYNSISFHSWQS